MEGLKKIAPVAEPMGLFAGTAVLRSGANVSGMLGPRERRRVIGTFLVVSPGAKVIVPVAA